MALGETALYAISSDDKLLGWDLHRPNPEALEADLPSLVRNLHDSALSLAVSAETMYVGHIAGASCIHVFDVTSPFDPHPETIIRADSGSVFDLKVSDAEIVAGLGEGMLKIWSKRDFRLAKSMRAQEHFVLCVATDPEFTYGGGADRCIRVYRNQDYGQAASLMGHDASVFCLEVDDDFLYSGSGEIWWGGPGSPRPPSFESAVRVWSKDDWDCIAILEGHQDNVNAVCVDSSAVFSVSDDSSLRTYSLGDWEPLSIMELGAIRPTSLSQDADYLYVGCSDGFVRMVAKSDLIES